MCSVRRKRNEGGGVPHCIKGSRLTPCLNPVILKQSYQGTQAEAR